jgi:hypothetical protein
MAADFRSRARLVVLVLMILVAGSGILFSLLYEHRVSVDFRSGWVRNQYFLGGICFRELIRESRFSQLLKATGNPDWKEVKSSQFGSPTYLSYRDDSILSDLDSFVIISSKVGLSSEETEKGAREVLHLLECGDGGASSRVSRYLDRLKESGRLPSESIRH